VGSTPIQSATTSASLNGSAPGEEASPVNPSAAQEVISFFKTLAIFLVIAFLLRASVVEAFKIPSGSMIPTLRIGDHILVSKLSYGIRLPFVTHFVYQFAEPQRGDIVVFTRPDEPDTNIIKRVIGVPGDLIEVRQTKLFVNNQLQYEPYARYELNGIKNFGPERVPVGHIFMMGDNRDHSRDSRFWEETPWLEIQRVKGRALIIYWSWDPSWRDRLGKLVR
jgi:signal peptidase I